MSDMSRASDKPARKNAAAKPDAPKLGALIRDLRKERKMTLTDLSSLTGISLGTLSQIERDLVSPTVRTLFTLSSALDVAPAWLIGAGDNAETTDPYVVRADQRQAFIAAAGVRKDLVSTSGSTHLKGFYMVIEPGAGSGAEPYSHKGEEIGLVLGGVLKLEIADRTYVLREGDCFTFTSNLPHRFSTVGASPATVFWVNAQIES
ncbi:cupin domain-containing protein [Paraburkholderia nemoris]|uniref:helix-turn-helix domain-containing protein n=1 Tax=Paraburkholderia nemoris TaxID=2793076 RepID=UPI0038BD0A06